VRGKRDGGARWGTHRLEQRTRLPRLLDMASHGYLPPAAPFPSGTGYRRLGPKNDQLECAESRGTIQMRQKPRCRPAFCASFSDGSWFGAITKRQSGLSGTLEVSAIRGSNTRHTTSDSANASAPLFFGRPHARPRPPANRTGRRRIRVARVLFCGARDRARASRLNCGATL